MHGSRSRQYLIDNDDGDDNLDDHDNDDKDDYSCNSINFKVKTSRLCMEFDLSNI